VPVRIRPAPASTLPERFPLSVPRGIILHKKERALGLYLDGELARTFPVSLGRSPDGTKEREGDGRTPEGTYYICTRNSRSRFHLFLGLSYPNPEDASRGSEAGLISQDQRRAIEGAAAARAAPPWDTALGGEIGIHGGGAGIIDWTLGCIALDDPAVEVLWEHLRIGDPVLIMP
jgi:murein L,D-transpeptidase YafK